MTYGRMTLSYNVSDFNHAMWFYRDVVGFPVMRILDEADSQGAIFEVNDHILLEIFGFPGGFVYDTDLPSGVNLTFEVNNVDEHYQRLQSAGAEIIDDLVDRPWGERSFGIQAPDGLAIHFVQVIG